MYMITGGGKDKERNAYEANIYKNNNKIIHFYFKRCTPFGRIGNNE